MQVLERARNFGVAIESAAPALVLPEHEAGELAQLRFFPGKLELDRHGAQAGGAGYIALKAHRARVIEVEVSPDRLAFQAQMPNVFRGQPEGEIRVGDGVGLLLRADLKVDPAGGSRDVREARALLSATARGRRGGHLFGTKQQRLQIPE